MEAFSILPLILFIVVMATAIAERINVPYPLLLVITGLLAGFIPGMPNWLPPQNIILPLFLPPILFAAARLISWDDIKDNGVEIFSLSILLVIIKTIVIAFVISWIIPQMNFAESLVLGAIISPTDSIAATTILNKLNTKKHLVRTLEIESLFNDAVSIVLYKVAVFVVFSGFIYLNAITYDTIMGSIGGIAVGLVMSYLAGIIIQRFLRDSENELPIIMSLILAYVSYIVAEKFQVSGVLAVVAAGLFHRHTERHVHARTRLKEKSAWDTYIFFLNGLVFTVIGLQFPLYLKKVSYLPLTQLILFPLATISIIILLRFVWTAGTQYLSMKIAILTKRKKTQHQTFSWRDIIISTWSGMRGIVSLALALALPLQLSQTNAFPNRELIIFLTIITILFTLIVQGLTLPWLVRKLKVEKDDDKALHETTTVFKQLTKLAIEYVAHAHDKTFVCSKEAKRMVDEYYASRLLQFRLAKDSKHEQHELNRAAEKLLTKSLEYERQTLHKMLAQGKVSEEAYARILSKLDREEVGFAA